MYSCRVTLVCRLSGLWFINIVFCGSIAWAVINALVLIFALIVAMIGVKFFVWWGFSNICLDVESR